MIEIMQRKQGASNDVAIQIICGDLNIPMGSNEPAEKTYNDYFIDSSSKTDKTLSYESRTYIDFTDFWWKAKQKIHLFSAKPEVLDYAALFTGKGTDKENMTHKAMLVTAIAPMNKLDNPKEALSDHHGLISYIRNNYKN